MAKIKLKLEGFDELFTQIKKAGGSVDAAAHTCIKKSANIMHDELTTQMQSAGVESDLISRIPPPEITVEHNRVGAKVGYKMGAYNPADPSDGFKVVFHNYGTPRRSKHGKMVALGFIQAAKKKANPKIKKAQKETLDEILGGLNR